MIWADLLPAHDVEAPAAIAPLQQASRVYLSPHYDDIAFSLGITARLLRGGTMVNIFTRSKNLPNARIAARKAWTTDEISRLRDDEDAAFAASAGLTRINLGCEEPPVRGRHPKDLAGLAEDQAQLREPLRATLHDLARSIPSPRILFCPAAIGGHVNHLATMFTVVEMLGELRQHYQVMFYEDLPYASSFWRRQRGLRRLSRMPGVELAGKHFLRLKDRANQKLDLANAYASQQRRPARPERYTPSALRPRGPHEASWQIR
jgi:LmbE family N-acetylglucosaminyl deacetylase